MCFASTRRRCHRRPVATRHLDFLPFRDRQTDLRLRNFTVFLTSPCSQFPSIMWIWTYFFWDGGFDGWNCFYLSSFEREWSVMGIGGRGLGGGGGDQAARITPTEQTPLIRSSSSLSDY